MGKVRIIAGTWRGRKLCVPDKPGLRPTSDRTRETLFNWLSLYLPGSRCLDLFAGSGALGMEAASRGAREVVLVEQQQDVVRGLVEQVTRFAADNVRVVHEDALRFLGRAASTFDIVFLDPPFGRSNLLVSCCRLLEQRGWLSAQACVYVETESRLGEPCLPVSWRVVRRQRAGQVAYFLAACGDSFL